MLAGDAAEPFAAGAAHPHRPGGEFLRCAIEEPQPQSRSQQWHWWHYGTDLSKRWGSTTKCAFGTTKGAPEGEAVQCFCAKSRHAVGTPATHRFDAVPGSTAAAPSITAPAAAASTMGAACSGVPNPPIAWPERVLLILHMAGVSKDKHEALGVDLR